MAKKKTNAKWFMEQVENEQSGLKGFIRMLGVRPESVDDIAQEAFVIAYRKLTMFERGTNFGAWLRTIARNLVRNELRRQGRRRVLANDVAEFLLSRADEKSTHPSVEVEQAEQHEQRVSALRECLQKLPERSRRLVQQRYFEELSLGVIAAYLLIKRSERNNSIMVEKFVPSERKKVVEMQKYNSQPMSLEEVVVKNQVPFSRNRKKLAPGAEPLDTATHDAAEL